MRERASEGQVQSARRQAQADEAFAAHECIRSNGPSFPCERLPPTRPDASGDRDLRNVGNGRLMPSQGERGQWMLET